MKKPPNKSNNKTKDKAKAAYCMILGDCGESALPSEPACHCPWFLASQREAVCTNDEPVRFHIPLGMILILNLQGDNSKKAL
jgi:hypothetical protein